MKCFHHQTVDAVACCTWCGKAMCLACASPSPAGRFACSADCSAKLEQQTDILHAVLSKSNQSARASAFYCYLTAVLSAAAAIAAWIWLPSPFLIYFTGACAGALSIAGFWHGRVARKSIPRRMSRPGQQN